MKITKTCSLCNAGLTFDSTDIKTSYTKIKYDGDKHCTLYGVHIITCPCCGHTIKLGNVEKSTQMTNPTEHNNHNELRCHRGILALEKTDEENVWNCYSTDMTDTVPDSENIIRL